MNPQEHPRVRGDDLEWCVRRPGGEGTPPRARGRRDTRQPVGVHVRNTPACAGTTHHTKCQSCTAAEHPRVRGDDPRRTRETGQPDGTPPRARGRLRRDRVAVRSQRNTPACAGTTWALNPTDTAFGNTPACAGTTKASRHLPRGPLEHPRVRGDDIPIPLRGNASSGTPPRARGRRQRRPRHDGAGRNTPACAGTTSGAITAWAWRAEHPRVRGDDEAAGHMVPAGVGTPPRARGRPGRGRDRRPGRRNTPACAGTTVVPTRPSWVRTEHPRVRGDDLSTSIRNSACSGTPPRARGRQDTRMRLLSGTRNTPACAGTTRSGGTRVSRVREHPRVRGDDVQARMEALVVTGTPPRARGRRGTPTAV